MKKLLTFFYGAYLNILAVIAPAKAARVGFALFCRPFRLPLNDKQKQFFDSSEQLHIPVDGASVRAYKWGNGDRRILFLHGWQSHTYRWKAYIESLPKDKYTIYSLDAPGHGLSTGSFLSVPLYSDLIDTFVRDRGPFHAVVGHSLGGFSLLYTLHKFPLLQINSIVLLAPPGEAKEFISVFQKTLGLTDRTVNLVLDYFVSKYNVGPEYFSTSRFAPALKVKGVVIHDEEDNEAPYHHSVRLTTEWERAKLVSTKGFGHNLRSPKVVEEVVTFIETHHHEPALH